MQRRILRWSGSTRNWLPVGTVVLNPNTQRSRGSISTGTVVENCPRCLGERRGPAIRIHQPQIPVGMGIAPMLGT